jgi:hypothetical protein
MSNWRFFPNKTWSPIGKILRHNWFKNQKKDHQYLINAAIRAYIKHELLSDFS